MNNIEWKIEKDPIEYDKAIEIMEQRVADIHDGKASELMWFLEHPPIYTIGTSGDESDIINKNIPAVKTGRGGQITYHGPGQRVVYLMLDLRVRGRDVRKFVCKVEKWVIAALNDIGIKGEIRDGRIGVWVETNNSEEKIAAIGIRIRRWISFHGVSININPNLEHFGGIIPCGISPDEFGVTSINKLGIDKNMQDLDKALKESFTAIFA